MKPAKITKEDLLAILRGLVEGIELDDSYEGRISYSCIDEECGPDEFMVEAVYRVDNRYGQGGMNIIASQVTDEAPE